MQIFGSRLTVTIHFRGLSVKVPPPLFHGSLPEGAPGASAAVLGVGGHRDLRPRARRWSGRSGHLPVLVPRVPLGPLAAALLC